jgi:F-type H+-transporting ATPase subunit c
MFTIKTNLTRKDTRMKKSGFSHGALLAAFLVIVFASIMMSSVAYAQEPAAATEAAAKPVWHYLGAALGLGMIVIGAALGIGKFASAAAESIARQPAAAAQISGAVNLPLFLLEGVAILAEVFVLLIVLMR